jgi:hypothetical protein
MEADVHYWLTTAPKAVTGKEALDSFASNCGESMAGILGHVSAAGNGYGVRLGRRHQSRHPALPVPQ